MKQFLGLRLNILIVFFLGSQLANAQNKAAIFDAANDITWLGLDYSHAKFIGSASQFGDAGEVSVSDFQDKFIPAWNQIFIDEMKKFDVAAAVQRKDVKYALEVTSKANAALKREFFSNNPGDYSTIAEKDIQEAVKNYDFLGNKGIGLIFFVEGMSKGKKEGAAWVTFVDMDTKTVLLTEYLTGSAGGFGFKNYWIKPYYNILESVKKKEYKKWKKNG